MQLDLSIVKGCSIIADKKAGGVSRADKVLRKVIEEQGEYISAMTHPEKYDEHYSSEFADLMIASLDHYMTAMYNDGIPHHEALELLQKNIDIKVKKWKSRLQNFGSFGVIRVRLPTAYGADLLEGSAENCNRGL